MILAADLSCHIISTFFLI